MMPTETRGGAAVEPAIREPALFHEDERLIAAVFARSSQEELDALVFENELERRRLEKKALAAYFDLPEQNVFSLRQTHGVTGVRATPDDCANNTEPFFAQGDALYTDSPGILLCVRTADCLPLFLASRAFCGIIHAGWRGLAFGVLENNLGEFQRTRDAGSTLFAGPCIGADAYEVGPEVARLFPEARRASDQGKFLLDLRASCRRNIADFHGDAAGNRGSTEDRGEPPEFREIFAGCTYRQNDLYYSHRRGDRGRNLNVIMLKKRAEKKAYAQ